MPILSNRNNHKSWSYFISQDMERHTEVMKHTMHIFRGKMLRRTLLPIPSIAGKIDLDQKSPETKYVMTWYTQRIKMGSQHTRFISHLQQTVSQIQNYNYNVFLKCCYVEALYALFPSSLCF